MPHVKVNYDINRAEKRLRTIEMISKYREEKIKREFLKLEHELMEENEKMRIEQIKELQAQEYFKYQRERLDEY